MKRFKPTKIIMAMEKEVTSEIEGSQRVSKYIKHRGKKCRFNGYQLENGTEVGVVREPGSNYVYYLANGDTEGQEVKIASIMARLRDKGLC